MKERDTHNIIIVVNFKVCFFSPVRLCPCDQCVSDRFVKTGRKNSHWGELFRLRCW